MCTVSFISAKDRVIITSNRDEKVERPSAIAPAKYTINDKSIYFPKDPKAGGTWFATDAHGTVLVLLNGAEEKHQQELLYRKSRGLIVVEMISSLSPKDFWDTVDLARIEPFTLVLYQEAKLYQLRWNGIFKDVKSLDTNQNHLWSSSTLYSKEVRQYRYEWFKDFLVNNPVVSEKGMLRFHQFTQKDNQQNGLVINRNEQMKTLSITQAVIEKRKVTIAHNDLIQQQQNSLSYTTI